MPKKKALLGYLFAAFMAVAIQITSLSPIVAEITKDFQLDMVQTSRMLSVNSFSFMFAVLLCAVLSRFVPRKMLNAIGCLAAGCGMLLMNVAKGYGAILLIIGVVGGLVGLLENSVLATVDDVDKENATFNVNLMQGFFGLGAMAAPLTVSILVVNGLGWRPMYTIMGVIYLAIALLLFIGFRKVDTPPDREMSKTPGSTKAMFKDWRFWLGAVAMFCYTGAEGTGWGWMSSFMQSAQNLSVMGAAAAVTVFWLGMTIGRFATSWLTRRYSTARLCMLLAALSFVVTIVAALVSNPILNWVMAFLMGLCYSGQWSLILTNGTGRFQENKSVATAIYIAMGSCGMAVISGIAGTVASRFGVQVAMGSPAVLFLVVIAIIFALEKSDAKAKAKA